MKNLCFLPRLLSRLSLFVYIAARCAHAHDHLSCACAAEENGFTINCEDSDAMLDAVPLLQGNDCQDDCSSSVCKTNFFIIQSHHDYCTEEQVPEVVEDNLHYYESACEECEITRPPDPSLPVCPEVNCDDGSGNTAYQDLVSEGCSEDCSPRTCEDNFHILLAVHDSCPEDSLDQIAEHGFHDIENVCTQPCSVGDAASTTNQLVCVHDDSPAEIATWSAVASATAAAGAVGMLL